MNTELLPCPFCGNPLTTVKLGPSKVGVSCRRAECAAEETWFNNEAEAIAAWNRRAPQAGSSICTGAIITELDEARAVAERLEQELAEARKRAEEYYIDAAAFAAQATKLREEIERRDALSAAVRAVRVRFIRNSEDEFIDERLIGANLARLPPEISRNGR